MEDEIPLEKAQKVFNLAFDEAKSIIARLGHISECTNCGTSNYGLTKHNDRATMVNMPIVNAADGIAHWAYFLCCPNCGSAKLVDAAAVINAMEEGTSQ